MIRMAFAAALLLAACAPTQAGEIAAASGDRDCFRSESVSGFNVVDQNTVRLNVSGEGDFLLTTNWNTRWLNWDTEIALRSSTGWICAGNGLGVELVGGEPRRTYAVTDIRREPEGAPAQGS